MAVSIGQGMSHASRNGHAADMLQIRGTTAVLISPSTSFLPRWLHSAHLVPLCFPSKTVCLAVMISIWSNSDCGKGDTTSFGEMNPVALNYGLDIDVYGTPGATVHSYEVNQRPTCANGTEALFAFYHGKNCQSEGLGSALNAVHSASEGVDGECLALVEFNSVAFICAGIGDQTEDSTTSSSSKATSTAASSPTSENASPISTTRGPTPYYSLPTGYSRGPFPSDYSVATASSTIDGSSAHTAGSSNPSTSVFAGSGCKYEMPLKGTLISIGSLMMVLF